MVPFAPKSDITKTFWGHPPSTYLLLSPIEVGDSGQASVIDSIGEYGQRSLPSSLSSRNRLLDVADNGLVIKAE